jgi:hypothetical protein
MANQKITDLTSYTPAIDTDVLPIVDVTTSTTKKITWANIKATLKVYFDTLYPTTKATASEVATGTDDTKYTTALAVQPYANQSLYRQAIINGNFDVWQRGTTITNPSGSGFYTADRWAAFRAAFANNITVTRQTAEKDGSIYCARVQRTAGDTQAVYLQIGQNLETLNSIPLRNKVLTLSFWAKVGANFSATALSAYVGYSNSSNVNLPSDGGSSIGSVSIPSTTTTKTKFTITTTAVPNTANTIIIAFSYTATGTAGANDWFEIEQVQLCAGSVALPFQPKSFAEELRDCQRYCYGITTVSATEEVAQGMAVSTTVSYPSITLPVTMRTLPTITGTAADWQLDDGINAPTDVNALVIDDLGFSNTRKVVLKASAASGLTAYRPYYLVGDGNAGRILIISAEL